MQKKAFLGKSLVVRTLIQYHLDRTLPFVAVETDRSNPDVAGIYNVLVDTEEPLKFLEGQVFGLFVPHSSD